MEEAVESRRSKLVPPYGLLSSSFHIMRSRGLCLQLDKANGDVQVVVADANADINYSVSTWDVGAPWKASSAAREAKNARSTFATFTQPASNTDIE